MNIIEALIQYKDDIKLWGANKFKKKVPKTRTINGLSLEDDINLSTKDIEGFQIIEEDLNTIIGQLNGYSIRVVAVLPEVIEENTIYFVKDSDIYVVCRDNIFFDVIAKLNSVKADGLITDNVSIIAVVTDSSNNTLLTTADVIGTTDFCIQVINTSKLGSGDSKEFSGLGSIDIDSDARLDLEHPLVKHPVLKEGFEFFSRMMLRVIKSYPRLRIIHEFIDDLTLRKGTSGHISPNQLSNEIRHEVDLAHPKVIVPSIYVLSETDTKVILNIGISHSGNIKTLLGTFSETTNLPEELPVANPGNIFGTLLSHLVSIGTNSKIEVFKKEGDSKATDEIVSTESATLGNTTWEHPIKTETETETDLHIYQSVKTSYKNNILTIK